MFKCSVVHSCDFFIFMFDNSFLYFFSPPQLTRINLIDPSSFFSILKELMMVFYILWKKDYFSSSKFPLENQTTSCKNLFFTFRSILTMFIVLYLDHHNSTIVVFFIQYLVDEVLVHHHVLLTLLLP